MPQSPPPLGSSLPLERRLGPAADGLRAILHPSTKGVPSCWLARLCAEAWLSAWRDDPRGARAIPVVAARLAADGHLATLPAAERAIAEAALAWGALRAQEIAALAADLAAASRDSGARVLLCKGAALHGLLYATAAERPAADVDVFVPGEEVTAFDAALRARGFVPGPGTPERVAAHARSADPGLIDLAYTSPAGMGVEVKADPVAIGAPPLRLAALAERARPSPLYPGLLLPSAETMVLQQAFSLARRDVPDLLGFAELAGVLRRRGAEFDPDRVLALVAGDGVGGLLATVLETTERLYPGTVPLALRRRGRAPVGYVPWRLRSGAAGRGAGASRWASPGRWLAQALSTHRRANFLAWVRHRAFPPGPLGAYLAREPGAWPVLQWLRRPGGGRRPAGGPESS